MDEWLKKVDALYAAAPCRFIERWLIRLRLRLSSYSSMRVYVPDPGRILDLGCGFGMFAVYLALSSRQRSVRGMDIAGRRIYVARLAAGGVPNVSFVSGDIARDAFPEVDGIVLIDALHYFAPAVQDSILERCGRALRYGGTLLIRNADTKRRARYAVTSIHEIFMTRSGFTRGAMLHFRPISELRLLLGRLGFRVRVLPMWGRTPFADTLLVCSKETTDCV